MRRAGASATRASGSQIALGDGEVHREQLYEARDAWEARVGDCRTCASLRALKLLAAFHRHLHIPSLAVRVLCTFGEYGNDVFQSCVCLTASSRAEYPQRGGISPRKRIEGVVESFIS